jgi:hypothetical protein
MRNKIRNLKEKIREIILSNELKKWIEVKEQKRKEEVRTQ